MGARLGERETLFGALPGSYPATSVGVIECIAAPDQPLQFDGRVKQGTVTFPTLPEAEAWLQKRQLDGAKIIRG